MTRPDVWVGLLLLALLVLSPLWVGFLVQWWRDR